MVKTATSAGFITQIIGPVVDAEFPNGKLPKIYNAIIIGEGESAVTCEVQQLLGDNLEQPRPSIFFAIIFPTLSLINSSAIFKK